MKNSMTRILMWTLGGALALALWALPSSSQSSAQSPATKLICAKAQTYPSAPGPGKIVGSNAACPAGTSLTGGTCENSAGVLWAVSGTTTNGGTTGYSCTFVSLQKTGAGNAYNACALCR